MEVDEPGQASSDPTAYVLRSMLSRLAASSVIIVALLYATGRLLAEIYYREFGLTATSARLASSDLVAQAAGSGIWLLVLAAPGLILAALVLGHRTSSRLDGLPQGKALTKKWPALALLLALELALLFGVPIVPVFLLGDPGRLSDYGIPVAAIGLGFVAFSAAMLSTSSQRQRLSVLVPGLKRFGIADPESVSVGGLSTRGAASRTDTCESIAMESFRSHVLEAPDHEAYFKIVA
jgi:hypothetical protein